MNLVQTFEGRAHEYELYYLLNPSERNKPQFGTIDPGKYYPEEKERTNPFTKVNNPHNNQKNTYTSAISKINIVVDNEFDIEGPSLDGFITVSKLSITKNEDGRITSIRKSPENSYKFKVQESKLKALIPKNIKRKWG